MNERASLMAPGVAGSRSRPSNAIAGWLGANARQRMATAMVALVGLMLVSMVTVSFQGVDAAAESEQGDVVRQILLGGLFIVFLLVAGPTPPALGSGSRRAGGLPLPFSMIIFLGYCLISVSWAIAPLVSLRRLGLTVIVIWMIFRAVGELGYGRTVKLIRWTLLGVMVANFISLLIPGVGLQPDTPGGDPGVVGDWRGLQPHKNIGGAVCAFTMIFFLFDRRSISTYILVPVLMACALFLYFSHSKTSEGVLLVALLSGWLIRPYSADYRALLAPALVIGAGLALQLGTLYLGDLSVMMADPSALSGRSQIWPLLLTYASEHPLKGAGFGSFWQIGDDSPIYSFTDGWIAQYAGHGHNGFLDLLVTLGVPGLLLGVLALIVWPLMRLLLSLSIPKGRRSLLLALLIFCIGHNVTETSLMDRAAVVQIFLVLAIALIFEQSSLSDGAHHRLKRRWLAITRRRSRSDMVGSGRTGPGKTAVPRRAGGHMTMRPPARTDGRSRAHARK
ncbi:hypothetical protein CG471_16245 [Sphingobium sp. IP1]|nr:hypothetical protein CG471_16245 [Sphingobium sp. IP1]